jgi:hypothetical protein
LAQFSDLRCEQECCNTRFNHAPSYPGELAVKVEFMAFVRGRLAGETRCNF